MLKRFHILLNPTIATLLILCLASCARQTLSDAQPEPSEPQQESNQLRRGRQGRNVEGYYKGRIDPHWIEDSPRFWYCNRLREGTREFILVDAEKAVKGSAFDHERLAAGLTEAGGTAVDPDRLPFDTIEFARQEQAVLFAVDGVRWSCDLKTYRCTQADGEPSASNASNRENDRSQRSRSRRGGRGEVTSPDGRWVAYINEYNLFIRSAQTDEDPVALSTDGSEDHAYSLISWAPDGQVVVAFRVEPGDNKEVYLVESSPDDGARARLHARSYALPGDKFAHYELNLFNVDTQQQMKPEVEKLELEWQRPQVRWLNDGPRFAYEKIDRGHQRFRVIEVDALTGQSRNLIDETSQTFIWTAHTESLRLQRVNWMDETNEIIYASEQDGWRHLYLVDIETTELRQITKGPWVVRGIDRIDEDARQIWFHASGMNPDQDPYFIHYYRINFDGTGLVALTEGNGTHSIQYSPDRRYLIDTYSRVDQPPVHTLRRVADGALVCELETADISGLLATGWQPPEVFVAKGRDGQTDIWGIICRPAELDPAKKYPVIEQIYAGPQSAYVPKSFSPSRRFSSYTDLGFIVVQMDGMGTAHRSKAFHDVCWHNLKDAGFPDRILWHRAAAAEYPYYDISRVGVYGTSAGGQNAAGAVLFYPDFYKVAVASCGCHDNRMDKASWNEQWMGYPVDKHYSENSNIDNAHRLKGHLLLIVGEMDNNVPPENTLRFADALIKAGKDFDLVVVPGAGHGGGGRHGERKRRDFFRRHLLSAEVENHNLND